MSFFDCIQTAIDTGKTSPKKGHEAQEIYTRRVKELETDQPELSPSARDIQAALDTLEETTNSKAKARRVKMAQMRAAHTIYQRAQAVNSSKQLPYDLVKFSDEIEETGASLFKQALGLMAKMVEASRPRAVGLFVPKAHHEDVVRASFKEKVNSSAQELWEGAAAGVEFLRGWANREGAFIPKGDNYIPQIHDRVKMLRAAGRRGDYDAAKKVWVDDHLKDGILDWEDMRSKYDGKKIPLEKRAEVLGRVFDIIVTDGGAKKVGREAIPDRENLAQGLSHERFLKYANADAWLEMNGKYGIGNVHEQLTSFMKSMSDDIALMSAFGPDPSANKGFLHNVYQARASQVMPGETPKVDRALRLLDARYKIQSNNVPSADDVVVARVRANLSNYITGTFLASAFIPQLADAGFAGFAAKLYGLPSVKAMMGPISEMARLTSRERRMFALQEGLGMDSAVSQALGAARYMGPLDGGWLSKRYVDTMMRATLFTPLTQGGRTAWGANLYTAWANFRDTGFDDLPFKKLLDDANITSKDWDAIRKRDLKEYNGAPYMSPTDMMHNGSVAEQRIALKFLNAVEMSSRRASPYTTSRERALLVSNTDPGTFSGESLRAYGQFKGFLAATTVVHWQDAMMQETRWGTIGHLAKLFLWMTTMGVGIVQLQALSQGKTFEDMDPRTHPDFWMRAMIKGGGLAFIGEIMDTVVRSGEPGGSLSDKFTAPVVDFADDFKKVTFDNLWEFAQGKETKFAKEGTTWLAKNAPPGRMWPFKAVWQAAITDELLMMTDPAAYRRTMAARRRTMEEHGQRELVW